MADPFSSMAQGAFNIGSTYMGRKDRQAEYANAESEFNSTKATYQNLDTSNPYANMENSYEDLTVNTQQADYTSQQQQQALSNTMGNLQGAASGGGIASLAQAMAGQQSQNLQAASASIGAQETQNTTMAAQGAMNNQTAERRGEVLSRNMKRDQASTEYGMSQARMGAAKDAKAAATAAYAQGAGQIVGGVASMVTGMPSWAGANPFMQTGMGVDGANTGDQ